MGAKIIEPPTGSELRDTNAAGTVAAADRAPSDVRASRAEMVAPSGPPKSLPREYFESAVVTIIMALFGMTFIVQAVKVPTGSMQNTINIGDQLLVNKFIFAPGMSLPFLPQRAIERGDVIVFKYPGNPHDTRGRDREPDNIPFRTNYVKRVIGLPGDTVELRGDIVYINGNPLPERRVMVDSASVGEKPALEELTSRASEGASSYTVYHDMSDPEPGDVHYAVEGEPTLVPDGSYFVMGDNRDNSADGRVWGFVPRELIVGRAAMVYWSYDLSDESGGNPIARFFRNTRWNRTGTMIR